MYLGYKRRAPRSAMGFSLDEVVNAVSLQQQLMHYTVKRPGKNACWMWNGPVQQFKSKGRWGTRARLHVTLERGYLQVSPARLTYLFDAGELPDRRRIAHTCGESLCIRPDHIVLAQQNKHYWARVKPLRKQQERDEIARVMAEHAMEGLSGETVEQIKFYAWLGESARSIAKNFGIKEQVVKRILNSATAPPHLAAI
jgi:hypothetical protein